MTLNEFINKRCAELGITRTQLLDRGNLSWATLSNIGKGVKITTVTKEKLARGLQCTIGDINACLTGEPNPLRKEAATRESTAGKQYEPKGVMETVDKLEKMVSEKPYVTPDPADEEPAEVFTDEPETDTDSMVLAVEEYKEQWRNKIIKQLTEADLATTVEEFWREIGKEFAKEVL